MRFGWTLVLTLFAKLLSSQNTISQLQDNLRFSGLPMNVLRGFKSSFFLTTAGALLALTAALKLASALGGVRILSKPDPLFWFLSNRQMLVLAALLEMTIALIIFFHKSVALRAKALVWISTMFVFYRVGLWWVGYKGDCPCFGHITDSLPLDRTIVNRGAMIILLYLLAVGYSLFLSEFFKPGAPESLASSERDQVTL